MKFIALLLSIIVLTLTITPCCALEDRESHVLETTQNEQHECDRQSDDCCKDCSPFYVCGTCIGFTVTTPHTITFTIPEKPVKHNTAYIPGQLPLIPITIWQPPKLS